MSFKLITAQTDWAVSLSEAKAHLDITSTDTDNDAYVQTLIEAAQSHIEESCDLSLTAATYDLHLDKFPGIIEIWMYPIASIGSVKYTDSDGNTQTVTSSNYTSDLTGKPARIDTVNSYTWPTPRDTVAAVQIQFTTGWTSPATCPGDLKQALLLLVRDWYNNREDKGRRFNRISEKIINKYKYR